MNRFPLWLLVAGLTFLIGTLIMGFVRETAETARAPVIPLKYITEWDLMYEALIQVESEGNPQALNKNSGAAGVIQIMPVYVAEANRLVGNERYCLDDRFDPIKSREMFEIIQAHHNPYYNIIKAIRDHNPKAGRWYLDRVLEKMDSIRTEYERKGFLIINY